MCVEEVLKASNQGKDKNIKSKKIREKTHEPNAPSSLGTQNVKKCKNTLMK